MSNFLSAINPILIAAVIALWVFIPLLWLFLNRDRLKHPEEYKTTGEAGERAVYLQLKQIGVLQDQILRNVYLPTKHGTTEIDLLIISMKGVLVFEVKNYGGNIYGDGNRKFWIQYIGHQKNKFYNPLLQNRTHVQHVKEFLSDEKIPVIPFTSTIKRGNWKLKNINPDDHFLHTGDFIRIYNSLPETGFTKEDLKRLILKFKPYERPDDNVKTAHIKKIQQVQGNRKN